MAEFALAAAITCHLCVEDNVPLWMPFPQQIHHGTPPSRVPRHDDKQRRPLSVIKGAVTACRFRALRTSVLPRCQNTLVRLSYLYSIPPASQARHTHDHTHRACTCSDCVRARAQAQGHRPTHMAREERYKNKRSA